MKWQLPDKQWYQQAWQRLPSVGLMALVGAVATYVGQRYLEADFGWHLRAGQYILDHGVPPTDIFTYTAVGHGWVNHEWLGDVAVAGLAASQRYWLLALVYGVLWALAYGLAVKGRPRLVPTLVVAAALVPYLGVRPMVWSALGLVVLLRLLEQPRRWRWLPVVLLLWANLHGGFVLGLATLGVAAVERRSWQLAGWALVAAVVTLANPYGWQLYGEIWQTATDSRLHGLIGEWAPLALDYTNVGLVAAAVAVVAAGRLGRWRRWLGVLLVGLTLAANRQLPLLALALAEPLNATWHGLIRSLTAVRPGLGRGVSWGAALIAAAVLAATLWLPVPRANVGLSTLPNAGVRMLRAEPCRGRLFNHYDYGGFIIWQLPGIKVYIDGRMPSWSGPEGRYLDRWQRVLAEPAYADHEFARYNVRCALIKTSNTVLVRHLAAQGWRVQAAGGDSQLWRRD